MIRVLVCGKLAEQGLALLYQAEGMEVTVEKELTADRLKEMIPAYDAVTVRSETKITKAILERAKNLKVIVRAGIGVDNIDVSAATQKGVIVMNTPSGNTITTAEHAISMLLSLCRHIPQATGSLKSGQWAKKRFTGLEIFSKTLGIIGLGNVGRIVADRAIGLKMKVLAYDPFISKEAAEKLSVTLVQMDDLLSQSDFVTIHVPLTEQTRHLINRETLKKMKKGALLIQCARGGIVNEKDLYQALESGHLGGAALDVFEMEPPGDHPLLQLENVICTPHLGAATGEAQVKVGIETAEQLMDYFERGIVRNSVNMPTISPALLKALKPYLVLSEKLGVFQGQIMGAQRLKSIAVEYSGEIIKQCLKPLTRAVLKGFLQQHLEKGVNHVNALVIAQERGIDVKATALSQSTEFTNLISVTVTSNGKQSKVSGTIFNRNEPRFVRIDRFHLEVVPEGNLLFVRNKNEPGVIGHIGTVLGKRKINISRFQLGLDQQKGEALSLISIDSPVDVDIIRELLALPHMIEVKRLSL